MLQNQGAWGMNNTKNFFKSILGFPLMMGNAQEDTKEMVMIKKYGIVLSLFLLQSFMCFADEEQTSIEQDQQIITRAFSAPNNSSIFPTETLFSGSDIGRRSFHMYRSSVYKLSRPVNYQPSITDESVSSPMLKITGSTIIVDLNGFALTRKDVDTASADTEQAVGIEIGWSPRDAQEGLFNLVAGANFATVQQPSNVIIRNGTIDNFGIGIVIHAGVKNVTLENITITNCALGIVCAGQETKKVLDVTIKNVTVSGDGTDRSSILSWAQQKLEGTNEYTPTGQMGYGSESIMILQENPEDPSAGDNVLVYSGIACVHTNNLTVSDVQCTHIGYAQTTNEGAGAEIIGTATYGMYYAYCSNVQVQNIDVSNNRSERFVTGLYVFNCQDVHAYHVKSIHQSILVPNAGALIPTSEFGLQSIGLVFKDSYNVNVDDIDVSHTQAAAQIGEDSSGYGTVAMGMYIDECDVLSIKNTKIDHLYADDVDRGSAFGLYIDSSLETVDIENISICNANTSDLFAGIHVENELLKAHVNNIRIVNNSSEGYFYGVYIDDDLTACIFENIQIDRNDSLDTFYGFAIDYDQTGVVYKNISMIDNEADASMYGFYNEADVYRNVSFENIDLKNMSSSEGFASVYGFYFSSDNQDEHELDEVSFKHITIHNLSSLQDVYGIYIYASDDDDGYDVGIQNLLVQDVHIHGLSGSTVACGIQIELASDDDAYMKGVTITNSSFAAYSAENVQGILLAADGDDDTILETLHVKNISMHDFDSNYCSGLYIVAPVESADIQSVKINNITGSGDGAYGIYFDDTVKAVQLTDCVVANMQAVGSDAYPISFWGDCNSISLARTSIQNVTGNDIRGLYFNNSVQALSMDTVSVDGLSGQDTVYGMYISHVLGADIKHISVSNTTGSNARGLAFMGSIKNASIDGLQVSGTRATAATDTTNNLRFEDAHAITVKNVQCDGLYQETGSTNAYSIDFVVIDDSVPSEITLENVQSNNGYNATGGIHGIYFGAAYDVSLKNVSASGNRSDFSHAYGISVGGDASQFSVDTAQVNSNTSHSGSCIGLFLAQGINSGSMRNVSACNNQVTGSIPGTYVCGIKIGNSTVDATYSASSVDLENIVCNGNIGPDTQVPWGTAPYLTDAQTRSGEWNLVQAAGLWVLVAHAVHIKHVQCNSNSLQDSGLDGCTFGVLLDGAFDVLLEDVSCSNNSGNALCAGLFVNEGMNVSVSASDFSQNYSNDEHVNTETRISYHDDAQSINYSKHTVTPSQDIFSSPTPDVLYYPKTIKGTYGVLIDTVDTLSLDAVQANQNSGFRAFGMQLRSCNGVSIKDCITNDESASGDLFVQEAYSEEGTGILQGGINGSSVDVPVYYRDGDSYAPDVFGSQLQADQYIDLRKAVQDYLATVTLLKNAPDSNEIVGNVHNMYTYHKDFVQASMLLRATIAQVRAWGVAAGVQCNNCSRVQIDNLIACGNTSQEDCAYGLIFANHCTDCTVRGGQFNYNRAWTDSAVQEYTNTIDTTALNPLWASLDYNLLYNGDFVSSSTGGYGVLYIDDADEDTGRFELHIDEYDNAELCTPCGPIAAGIVIGDTSERVHVSDVVCAGNQGNAGQAYGLMHDVSLGSSVQNSQFYQNMTNTCGIAYGLADFTPQSGSLHLGNIAFGNQYDSFVDSNYIVPFNPGGSNNLEFPIKIGYNGNITELANASPYDNIEIRFTYHTPEDTQNMPDGVFTDWVSNDWIRDEVDEEDVPAEYTGTMGATYVAGAGYAYIYTAANMTISGLDETFWGFASDTLNNVVVDGSNEYSDNSTDQAVSFTAEFANSLTAPFVSGTFYVNVDEFSQMSWNGSSFEINAYSDSGRTLLIATITITNLDFLIDG